MNTLAYLIYLFITYFITVRTGWLFYRNGRVYIITLLKDGEKLADFINRMLLTGYYLINLGYAAVMIRYWQPVTSCSLLVSSIANMTGRIMLTLAFIHCCNMAAIYFLSKRKHHFITHTNQHL